MHSSRADSKTVDSHLQEAVLDALPANISVIDRDGIIIAVNEHWRSFAKTNGSSGGDFIGDNYIAVCESSIGVDSEEARLVADSLREVIAGKRDGFSIEYPCHSPEEQRWFRVTAVPIRADQCAGAVVMHLNITERKLNEIALDRNNRALQLLTRCNDALIRSESELELAQAVCGIAVETGNFRMAWVGYARDNREKSIEAQAWEGASADYLTKMRISWDENDPTGQGPAGRVIRSGRPVVIPDLQADASFRPWRDNALEQGLQGLICLPLKHLDRTFGILALYPSEPNAILAEELGVLEELGENMAFGIMNHRARIWRHKTQDAVMNMARGVSASTGAKFFEQLAFSMVDTLGADGGIIARLSDDLKSVCSISVVFDGRISPNLEYPVEGLPCGELVHNDVLVVPDDLLTRYPELRHWQEAGIRAYVGAMLVDASGSPIGLMYVVYRKPQEDFEFVVSTLRIFAARAGSELARQQADILLREQAALLDLARDAIVVRDMDSRVLYWNRSAERLYGWSAGEAVGSLIQDLLSPDPAAMLAAVQATIAAGEWMGEIQQFTKDGRALIAESRWTLVRDEYGELKSILAINTDITERKKLEKQFLRAQRVESIGTLAGGIAHDLNNVLAPIMMSIDLLRMYVEDPVGLEILDMVEKSAGRGAEMVKQVLSFARGMDGQVVEIQIVHIVQDLLRIVEDTFPKNIRVTGQFDKDLWLIKADPTQIHQVLLNVCLNARDAMPDGGQVTLKIENVILDEHYAAMHIEAVVGPYLKIDIEDNGHGIPRDIIDRIFDPFFTTKEVGKGTGLGLSTSLAIIKSHGGFIRVYSDCGVGSSFRIYLPAVTENGLSFHDLTGADLPRGKGETVLVVDDEASIRFISKQTLEAFGYKVLLAADGSEAISVYVSHQDVISVVLTDMMMPIMDGPATIQVLRRLRPDLRIIGASGITANGKVARAFDAGVNHFLPKPYTAEALLKVIRRILDEPQ